MFYILIFGTTMSVLSAIFWCLEALPGVNAIKALKQPTKTNNPFVLVYEGIRYIFGFTGASFKLWPLGLDIFCTVWLAGAFGFSGLIGGVIGLSISNVISIFIMFIARPAPVYNRA